MSFFFFLNMQNKYQMKRIPYCGAVCMVNQVLNFNGYWNDLPWSREWCKVILFLNLFGTYFWHLLNALPPCNVFIKFLCGIFASQKFYKLTCCSWVSSLNCHKLNKMSLFIHSVCMSWPLSWYLTKNEPRSTTIINLNNVFVFHHLLNFRLAMK